ncbi:MAG: type II toxin-antitoxin system VapC family toxin [Pseudomonadota bacterium]|nr:type II toxin-antitoxin system VapC family toxin [Pseudomonadota bacterium]
MWAVIDSDFLPEAAKERIFAAEEVFVSVASIWEIAIKHALGKGGMPVSAGEAAQAFDDAGYLSLPIQREHAFRLTTLRPLHRDPFDRLLVAQALSEPLTLLTRDRVVASYSDAIALV